MDHIVQSTQTLVKASIVAFIFAAVGLMTIILPAEYGIDPTGIGKAMGLTVLSDPIEVKRPDNLINTQTERDYTEDSVEITVMANQGLEYKFDIEKGDAIRYAWTSSAPLFFDFHGEPKGDTTGYFESYTISTSDEVSGMFTASFDGSHGWYWKNTSNSPIVVSLKTEGNYLLIGVK
ncbi:MAG: hypothetical protein CMF25_08260 [Kangiellaceae bacterium]|nr:hypothetical protein [Kangiellaceae bacterium]